MPKSSRISSLYIAPVQYGAIGPFKGTYMRVVLGPGVNAMYRGSKTTSGSIAGAMKALKAADPGNWVAGHLLAGELGGSGSAPKNLTPLTQNANKRMSSAYELKVKAWTIMCRQYMQAHQATWIADEVLGVFYEVIVSNNPMDMAMPYRRAPSHLTIKAEVRLYKGTGRVNKLPTAIRMYFGKVKLAGTISNRFEDL